jgi:hypothetical protein
MEGCRISRALGSVSTRAQSLRDCLNGRIGEALRLPAQGRCAGAPRCDAKPRLRPSSVPDEDPIPGAATKYSKTKPADLRRQGLLFYWWRQGTIAARLPERTNRRVLAPAGPRPLRRRVAVRRETPAPPLVRAGRGSDSRSRNEVFKNKGPAGCPAGPLFLNTGGGGGNRTLVRKHSTDSSTYLALSFNLTGTTGMCTLCTSELP